QGIVEAQNGVYYEVILKDDDGNSFRFNEAVYKFGASEPNIRLSLQNFSENLLKRLIYSKQCTIYVVGKADKGGTNRFSLNERQVPIEYHRRLSPDQFACCPVAATIESSYSNQDLPNLRAASFISAFSQLLSSLEIRILEGTIVD